LRTRFAKRGWAEAGGVISIFGGRGVSAGTRSALERRHPFAILALSVLALAGCATAPGVERLSPSSLGCMRAVVANKLPRNLTDKHAHCLAAGFIARYCSRPEAYVASWGKEFSDLFNGSNDFEWADLKADRLGIRCERAADSDQALESCCVAELRAHHLPVSPPARER